MAVESIDFENAIERNPFPLFYGEGMLRRFKLYQWTLSTCLRPDLTLQVQRVRVPLQFV